MRKLILTTAALLLAAGTAYADPIDGNWRTQSGETASISGGAITLKTGKFAGKRIGNMKATGGGKYAGTITDPASDKTYDGTAKLSGKSLSMKGCLQNLLGKIGGCRNQLWTKM